ncbi:M64 family metallopeptidase [Archangium gephyra]|uniref:M64 family metallopeptidase n=1 Tax=Archangium gephyra TaxID=48 RepID=UPI0035D47219
MGVSDGSILGTSKILDNGPASERWNLVILGDGYQQGQMQQYADNVTDFVNALFAMPPFNTLRAAINIYRVDVASTDSGADDPAACGGSGATPSTFFDATFCVNGIRRLLVVNNGTAITVANAQVPEWHVLLVVVNSTEYGGSGGQVGVFSLAPGANQIALHELGHTAFGLADEYEYYAGCGVDTDRNQHPALEPSEPNVTTNTNRDTLKWRELIAAATPIPTTRNANCTQCDPQPNLVGTATVGAFEGAHYYHCGAFRPQFNCMMRALGNFYCDVCSRRIREVLQPFMPTAREGEFYTTDGQGNLSLLRQHGGWRHSWARIVPGNFGGSSFTDLLFYDAAAGQGELYTTDGQGNISLLKQHSGWRHSWTHIIPGNFGGSGHTDLLFYDATAGQGELYTTDGQGNLSLLKLHNGWRHSWTHIIPGNFGGSSFTDLLFYDASAGQGELYTTDGHGNLTLLKQHSGWRHSWAQIVPGNFGGSSYTDLLFYDAAAGQGELYTTNGQGNLSRLKLHNGWRHSWTQIIPGNFGGSSFTDLLFYDATAGQGELYTTDGQGNLSLLKQHSGWRHSWAQIVPGNFGGSSFTDLLFYDRNAS